MIKKTIFLLPIIAVFIVFFASPGQASIHQSYPGHGDLGPSNDLSVFAFKQDPRVDARYTDKVRVFVPPGTVRLSIALYTRVSSYPTACIRYQNPPISCSGEARTRNLFDFINGITFTCTNGEGRDQLILDSFSPALTQEQAGWLYIKIPDGTWNNVRTSITINREIYDEWYNSINWDTDVEAGYYPDGSPPPPPPPSDTYSLTTVLSPEEVRAQGMWRLTSGPDTGWKSCSATVSNLPQDTYTVRFNDVPGWTRPSDIRVNLSSNRSFTGTYTVVGSSPGGDDHLSYLGHHDLGFSNDFGRFLLTFIRDDIETDRVRVFIPPGTKSASVRINATESSYPISFIRYQNPLGPSINEPEPGPKDLFYFFIDDRAIKRSGSQTVRAVEDSFTSSLNSDEAGWLYIRIEDDWTSVSTSISVDTTIYDEWYNSINWQTDVEPGYNMEEPPPTPAFLQSIYNLLLNDEEPEDQMTEQID